MLHSTDDTVESSYSKIWECAGSGFGKSDLGNKRASVSPDQCKASSGPDGVRESSWFWRSTGQVLGHSPDGGLQAPEHGQKIIERDHPVLNAWTFEASGDCAIRQDSTPVRPIDGRICPELSYPRRRAHTSLFEFSELLGQTCANTSMTRPAERLQAARRAI